jgi:hypothetical protein
MGIYAHQRMAESVGMLIAHAIAVALSGEFVAIALAFFGCVRDLLTEIVETPARRRRSLSKVPGYGKDVQLDEPDSVDVNFSVLLAGNTPPSFTAFLTRVFR